MRIRFSPYFVLLVPMICLLGAVVYFLPPVHERLAWRLEEAVIQAQRAIDPPEEDVFVPQEQGKAVAQATEYAQATWEALLSQPTWTPLPGQATPIPQSTRRPTPTPASGTDTPQPPSVRLSGFTHLYQNMNNCGPATLAMALSYWQWPNDLPEFVAEGRARELQDAPAAFLKPQKEDKNVSPVEMERFIEEIAGLQAEVRVGGTLDLIKSFLAAGFPVMVEKGFEGERFDGWMGHYEVLSGYEDGKAQFHVYDSYDGPIDIPFENLASNWRAFNYTYIIIYPLDRQAEVLRLLGPDADPQANLQQALEYAQDEAGGLLGRDRFFALYNLGSSLAALGDYSGASLAYDEAFALYPEIAKDQRPWRMLWYQFGPYAAYYYTGRYNDVVERASLTLQQAHEATKPDSPFIEESFYWRGLARYALGETEDAIADLERAVKLNPNFREAVAQLEEWGGAP